MYVFQPTKRNYLKQIATLFDPLGMMSPFIIRAKVLMQEIWACSLDWDDPLPEETGAKNLGGRGGKCPSTLKGGGAPLL